MLGEDHSDVVVHWNRAAVAINDPRDSVAAALAHMSTCQPTEWTLVALDSALNLKLVTATALERAFTGFPSKSLKVLGLADSGSQSGLETLARYRLRRFGIRHRTQVSIPGVGRVDVLIGDRLVLELDGRGFHSESDAFEADRRRDLALHALGYRVMRLSYQQVMHEWMTCERVIRSMILRGDHLWPRRRSAHNSG